MVGNAKSLWSIIVIISFFLSLATFIFSKFIFSDIVILVELPLLLFISSLLMLSASLIMGIRSIYGSIFFLASLGLLFWFVGFSNRSLKIIMKTYTFPSALDSFFLAGDLLLISVFVYFILFTGRIVHSTIQEHFPMFMILSLVEGILYAFITASYITLYMQGNLILPILLYVLINVLLELIMVALYIILVFAVKEGVIHQIFRSISFGLILILIGDYLFMYVTVKNLKYLSDFPYPFYNWAYTIFVLASIYMLQLEKGKKV